jgi:uncharacterized membrane protein YdbT with pleckstrin-like domain
MSPEKSDIPANQAMKNVVSSTTNNLPEEELWAGDFSPRAMYGAWLAAAIATIAGLVAMIMVDGLRSNSTAWWIYFAAVVILWIFLLLKFAYHKLSYHYELSTQRLRHRDGILVRTMNRIELVDIDDILYRQGIIQRMLGVGDITIKSRDLTHPMLVLHGIANVKEVANLIDNARLNERRRRSVRFESL